MPLHKVADTSFHIQGDYLVLPFGFAPQYGVQLSIPSVGHCNCCIKREHHNKVII